MKNNPAIMQQMNTLREVLEMVMRISKRELPEDSVTKGWTEFESGKDHAYETVIFNIQKKMDALLEKEEEWLKTKT